MSNDNIHSNTAPLETEIKRLRDQVKLLMAGENKLYVLQNRLNTQQGIYVRLAEISRELNVSLDVTHILNTVVHFVIYGFNYERCAVFLEDSAGGDEKVFRIRAQEGYYEDEDAAHIASAYLTGREKALLDVYGDAGFLCYSGENQTEDTEVLGKIFRMDEYYVFALKRKETGINGFLIAGNTKSQARYQTSVEAGGEMLTALSNLAAQTAITLANVQSYRALEQERQLLDRMVDERTRELSEALDAAHEAVRIKAEFLAKISHELRTPLNSIVNIPGALVEEYEDVELYCCGGCGTQYQSDEEEEDTKCPECGGALEKQTSILCTGDPSEHLKFLKLLKAQGTHLLGLVEDVLDFSKLGSGKMELNWAEVNLKELLEEIEPTMDAAMMGKNRTVNYQTLDGALCVAADRLRLKQVIINLIGNAVKFTPEGKEIFVGVHETTEDIPKVVFTIADQGIGIPGDQLESIFDSFSQVDGSHTRSYGGTGLGLAISRQLVEMHGGEISVSSVLGEGSTFTFFIPKQSVFALPSKPPAFAAHEAELNEPSTGTRGFGQVVVVDDEPSHLSMARKFLEKEGYGVTLVSDPKTALEVIRSIRPRCVILDIMMPEVNGLWLLSRLKQDIDLKRIPVIVSTAYHYNKKKAEEAGAFWLPKPWSREKLSARVIEPFVTGAENQESPLPTRGRPRLTDLVSRILYVEDEDANYEVTALSLRGKYQLDRARDSKEALKRLSENSYDLILMDIQLAGSDFNGIEMCEILTGKRTENLPAYAQGIRVQCPIVVVTAYAALYTKENMTAAGAADFITKPVDFTHLLIVLSRLMIRGAVSNLKEAADRD